MLQLKLSHDIISTNCYAQNPTCNSLAIQIHHAHSKNLNNLSDSDTNTLQQRPPLPPSLPPPPPPKSSTYKFRWHAHLPHALERLEQLLYVLRRYSYGSVSHCWTVLGNADKLGGPGVRVGHNCQTVLNRLIDDGVL